ncbi:MAG: glycosyltransferase family 9 protein, partial [Alphaproteobacteria bacterium]
MSAAPILVVKLGALGDVAQAFGAFAAIRAHHPGSRVVLLTTPPYAGLLARAPWFDEVWIEERLPAWRLAWVGLRARIRAAGFARVYDLQTSDRSDWIFRMIGPGPRPEWVGRVAGASHRHDDQRRDVLHTQERLAGQLAKAGVVPQSAPDLSWMDGDVAPRVVVAMRGTGDAADPFGARAGADHAEDPVGAVAGLEVVDAREARRADARAQP